MAFSMDGKDWGVSCEYNRTKRPLLHRWHGFSIEPKIECFVTVASKSLKEGSVSIWKEAWQSVEDAEVSKLPEWKSVCDLARKHVADMVPVDFRTLPTWSKTLDKSFQLILKSLDKCQTSIQSCIKLAMATKEVEFTTVLEGKRHVARVRAEFLRFLIVYMTNEAPDPWAAPLSSMRRECSLLHRFVDNVKSKEQNLPKQKDAVAEWAIVTKLDEQSMAVLKDVEISVLGDIVDSLEMSSTMFFDACDEAGLGSTSQDVRQAVVEAPSMAFLEDVLSNPQLVSKDAY